MTKNISIYNNKIRNYLEFSTSVGIVLSPGEAVKVRLSSELAVITGIHTSAVSLRSDRTCGSSAMADDIISSTSSNFADSLSNSLAISNYVDNEFIKKIKNKKMMKLQYIKCAKKN